eukprot:TRINITY_DN1728_c0_g1_i1.p1 TRINITY_DN1728_c0_g1~~TRINITY_DN1728_c0_g1_i1.p1  ORF type:complete len:124 (+),score=9.56 TRINITY_DN1728_c0_g1_i1:162-533(+)
MPLDETLFLRMLCINADIPIVSALSDGFFVFFFLSFISLLCHSSDDTYITYPDFSWRFPSFGAERMTFLFLFLFLFLYFLTITMTIPLVRVYEITDFNLNQLRDIIVALFSFFFLFFSFFDML